MTKLHKFLVKLGACKEAIAFANGKKLAEAWSTCERPDWMLWLCAKMIGKKGWPTHQQIVLAACDCAETTLPIFEKKNPNDTRPRKAIETARKWANGKATIKEVKVTAEAAYAATAYAADAAYAAANAAYAAYSAANAAYEATAEATADAGYAAYAIADAAHAAAYAATADADYRITVAAKRKELTNLIRKQLIIPT